MTIRVYVRWPGQQVSNKTNTESVSVAEFAYRELADKAATFAQRGALQIIFSENQKLQKLIDLTKLDKSAAQHDQAQA